MKIAIIGGHFSPALSVVQKLKGEDVLYIGRKYAFEGDKALSFEYQEISKLGIDFYPLNTARLQRSLTRHTAKSLLKLPLGFYQALKILRKTRPDVVLGFGGYVQLPVVTAANFLKIPIVIHEQTLEAGLANKLSSRFAKKICISWQSSEKYFDLEKIVLTGNPIREELIKVKQKKVVNKIPKIYITGGSGGSHAINLLVISSLTKLLQDFEIVHQTGAAEEYKDFDSLMILKQSLKEDLSKRYSVFKFLTPLDSAEQINSADLVIGRSGINTVTELLFLNKPAFLIPLPVSQRSEQLKNATMLHDLGLGEVVKQRELTAEKFVETIDNMLRNIKSYKINKELDLEDSALKIVEVLKDVAKTEAS